MHKQSYFTAAHELNIAYYESTSLVTLINKVQMCPSSSQSEGAGTNTCQPRLAISVAGTCTSNMFMFKGHQLQQFMVWLRVKVGCSA